MTEGIRAAAYDLHQALAATPLPLPLADSQTLREQRAGLLDQLGDHLLPRLDQPDRPILIVVGGPTGVGKSTLVNTVVGQQVTTSGLARPTTRSPVLVHHPDDEGWFGAGGILPTFTRVERASNDPGQVQLVAVSAMPPGVALLDAPDFDSVDDDNRMLATRLLAAADVWLFVTSAARYADEVPWLQLEVARRRGTPLLVVMNRIQPEDLATVSADFARQLEVRGLRPWAFAPGGAEVTLVPHDQVEDGMLPSGRVAAIRAALESFSQSRRIRDDIAWQGLAGALRQAGTSAHEISEGARHQVDAARELHVTVSREYDVSLAMLMAAATDGTLLRGNLLAHWREFIGVDEPLPMADMMRRAREGLIGTPTKEQEARIGRLELAIDLALENLVTEHAEQAAGAASRALRATPYGDAMLGWSEEDLSRPGRRLGAETRKAIGSWRRALTGAVFDLDDADQAATRGLVAGLAVCALGTPGADQRARGASGLVATAREGLADMFGDLMKGERARYLRPVAESKLTPDAPDRLRTAAGRLTLVVDRAVPRV